MTTKSAARMAKATKIARALLAQAPAGAWLRSGIAEGTEDFWLCAAQSAGVRSAVRDGRVPSDECQALVVELIRASGEAAA